MSTKHTPQRDALLELRRLKLRRLRAVNAELLAALEQLERTLTYHVGDTIGPSGDSTWPIVAESIIAARAAIAKARGA